MAGAANPEPGGAPGTVTNFNKFPQWGLKVDQSTGKFSIIEAKTENDKIADLKKGYIQWFSSQQAAQDEGQNSGGFFGSGQAPALNPIGEAIKYLAAAAEWLSNRHNILRVAEVILGAGLLFMGIQQLKVVQQGEHTVITGVGKAAKVAGTAALV